jgi:hypothetical protein
MSANNNNGAVIQMVRLKNGEIVKCLITAMMEHDFIIQDPDKAYGLNRRWVPIYDIEYISQEYLNTNHA